MVNLIKSFPHIFLLEVGILRIVVFGLLMLGCSEHTVNNFIYIDQNFGNKNTSSKEA